MLLLRYGETLSYRMLNFSSLLSSSNHTVHYQVEPGVASEDIYCKPSAVENSECSGAHVPTFPTWPAPYPIWSKRKKEIDEILVQRKDQSDRVTSKVLPKTQKEKGKSCIGYLSASA